MELIAFEFLIDVMPKECLQKVGARAQDFVIQPKFLEDRKRFPLGINRRRSIILSIDIERLRQQIDPSCQIMRLKIKTIVLIRRPRRLVEVNPMFQDE